MQLILIFLCTTSLKFEVISVFVIRIGLCSDWGFQSLLSAFIKLASGLIGRAKIQENIILYIQLFIFIMFFIQTIYDNKQSIAMLGLFVLNLSLSESTIHWLQCAKIFGFQAKLKKYMIVWHFSTKKKHNTYYVSLIKKHYRLSNIFI